MQAVHRTISRYGHMEIIKQSTMQWHSCRKYSRQ